MGLKFLKDKLLISPLVREGLFRAHETVISLRNVAEDSRDLVRYLVGSRGGVAKMMYAVNKERKGITRSAARSARKIKFHGSEKINSLFDINEDAVIVQAGGQQYRLPRYLDGVELLFSETSAVSRSAAERIVRNFAKTSQLLGIEGMNEKAASLILRDSLVDVIDIHDMERWTKQLLGSVPSIYDTAVDAVYHETSVGGGHLHRLLDGNHTLYGMWKAVREASPDDTQLQEVHGYVTALLKDLCTSKGLPFKTLTRDQYDDLAHRLNDWLGVSREWTQALLHINGEQLVGTVASVSSAVFSWNKAEANQFAGIVSSMGIQVVFKKAHPIVLVIVLVAAAKGFQEAKDRGELPRYCAVIAKKGAINCLCCLPSLFLPKVFVIKVIATIVVGVLVKKYEGKIDEERIVAITSGMLVGLRDQTQSVMTMLDKST